MVVVGVILLPLTVQAVLKVTVSKSMSVADPGVQVSVEDSVAPEGVSVTPDRTGAVFDIVTLVDFGVPLFVPSLGVTVQVTVSLPRNALESDVPVPTEEPPMVQLTVLLSKSPSGSVNLDQAQLSVSLATAGLGVIESPLTLGRAFEMVSDVE